MVLLDIINPDWFVKETSTGGCKSYCNNANGGRSVEIYWPKGLRYADIRAEFEEWLATDVKKIGDSSWLLIDPNEDGWESAKPTEPAKPAKPAKPGRSH